MTDMLRHLIFAGAGSALGGILRHFMNISFPRQDAASFPWSTLMVNILGSLLIGVLYGISKEQKLIGEEAQLFLMTGICGGFTTFSAFSLENVQMIQNGEPGKALVYAASSILIGLLAVWAGAFLSKQAL